MAIILMADIKESSKYFSPALQKDLTKMVNQFNNRYSPIIVSPLTITLGDEFQGVVKDAKAGLNIIAMIEEYMLSNGFEFKLRYVLYEGEIETPINTEIAHGMMGQGLTEARSKLNELKKNKTRFKFFFENKALQKKQNGLFKILQYLIDRWNSKDGYLISSFLDGLTYKEVATKFGKDDSLMWRRRKSLAIDEYLTCKSLILDLA